MREITRESVQELLSDVLDCACERLQISPVPTGKFNTSFYITTDTAEYVLRIAPASEDEFLFYERDMMMQEPDLHTFIRSETNVPVPKVIAYDFSCKDISRSWILMERLPGAPWTLQPNIGGERVLYQVGVYLREIHAQQKNRYGYIGAHNVMSPCTNWEDAFAYMWQKIIDDIVRVGCYDADIADKRKTLFEKYREYFRHDPPASLLHMDIWGQNIMVDEKGCVTGLIDWDRALWGDPEIEFAVLDYCGISEPYFWKGYGVSRDMSPEACVRRHFYLLYEMLKYSVIYKGRVHDKRAAENVIQQCEMYIADHLTDV